MGETCTKAIYEICAKDPARAAEVLAGEGSTGTFVRVTGETDALNDRFAIEVAELEILGEGDDSGGTRARLTVVVPEDLTGDDMTTLLASVAGNVSEVAQASAVRLGGLELSPQLVAACPLPRVGIAGTRALLQVPRRRLTAAQPPPPAGAGELAASVGELLSDGADIVRDPMPFADPPGLPLAARIDAIGPVLAEHRDRTGRGCMFAYSVDDEPQAMVEHAETIATAEGGALQLSAGALGLSAVAHLRRRTDLALHARTAPQPLLHRDPSFGIADSVVQKLWRLAGLDHLPVPPGAGPQALQDRLQPLLDDSDRALPVLPYEQGAGDADAIELLPRGRALA